MKIDIHDTEICYRIIDVVFKNIEEVINKNIHHATHLKIDIALHRPIREEVRTNTENQIKSFLELT